MYSSYIVTIVNHI